MGAGPFFAALGGTRILDTNKADQSGADDGNVIDWDVGDDFIIAFNINSGGKDTESAQYKLRYRVEGVGGFGDIDAVGAMKFGNTDLVNGAAILIGARKCDSQGGDTWQNGEEVEGVKDSDAIDLADEFESEVHISVSPADATPGTTYEFEAYDSTRGASVGTCGATLTIAVGTFELSVTDGIELGDSRSELMTALSTVTDGLKGGDTTSELGTMEASASDGVKLGDTTIGVLLLLLALTDGIKAGDSTSEDMSTDSLVTDGIKIGDSPVGEMSGIVVVSDGVKLGDTATENIIATVVTTDGIKVGDVTVNEMTAVPAVSDGALFGDTPVIELAVVTFELSISDGLKIGDSGAIEMSAFIVAEDGAKLGDDRVLEMLSEPSVSDGVKLSDITIGNIILSIALSDGVMLGDLVERTLTVIPRGSKNLGQSRELQAFVRLMKQRHRI